jgi:hypothetical protein
LLDMAEALAGMQYAGVVDQQVERAGRAVVAFAEHQRQFVRQARARFRIGHVQRQHVQAAGVLPGQRVQGGGLAGMAAGGDHLVASGQQLTDEFQANAAVGACDQGGAGHVRLLGWLPA